MKSVTGNTSENRKTSVATTQDASSALLPTSTKCSFRQCKNKDPLLDTICCCVNGCDKRIHNQCFQEFLHKNSVDRFENITTRCCATKVHYNRLLKEEAMQSNGVDPRVRWDADGPNGPDTEPNSLSVLLKWWAMEGNYAKYRGGKTNAGKSKEAFWAELSEEIKQVGIKCERTAASIGAKIGRMEEQYRATRDWLEHTGAGILEEDPDSCITDIVVKRCPFFYEIDMVMCDRASIRPLALSETMESDGGSGSEEEEGDDDEGSKFSSLDGSEPSSGNATIGSAEKKKSPKKKKLPATTYATSPVMRSAESKRPITVSSPLRRGAQKRKGAGNVEGILSDVQGTLRDIGESRVARLRMKERELEELQYTKKLDLRLKEREVTSLEVKAAAEARKIEAETRVIELQSTKELLLARQELREKGVPLDEIEAMLPLQQKQ